MKKFNVEVNWFGAYDANGWQVANDEPIIAATAEEAEENTDDGWLKGVLMTTNEDGELIEVKGAEYRFVEIEE